MEERIKKLEETVSTLEQAISNLTIAVNNKVDKYNVIAEINTSEEGIRIKGGKIYINNETLVEK